MESIYDNKHLLDSANSWKSVFYNTTVPVIEEYFKELWVHAVNFTKNENPLHFHDELIKRFKLWLQDVNHISQLDIENEIKIMSKRCNNLKGLIFLMLKSKAIELSLLRQNSISQIELKNLSLSRFLWRAYVEVSKLLIGRTYCFMHFESSITNEQNAIELKECIKEALTNTLIYYIDINKMIEDTTSTNGNEETNTNGTIEIIKNKKTEQEKQNESKKKSNKSGQKSSISSSLSIQDKQKKKKSTEGKQDERNETQSNNEKKIKKTKNKSNEQNNSSLFSSSSSKKQENEKQTPNKKNGSKKQQKIITIGERTKSMEKILKKRKQSQESNKKEKIMKKAFTRQPSDDEEEEGEEIISSSSYSSPSSISNDDEFIEEESSTLSENSPNDSSSISPKRRSSQNKKHKHHNNNNNENQQSGFNQSTELRNDIELGESQQISASNPLVESIIEEQLQNHLLDDEENINGVDKSTYLPSSKSTILNEIGRDFEPNPSKLLFKNNVSSVLQNIITPHESNLNQMKKQSNPFLQFKQYEEKLQSINEHIQNVEEQIKSQK